jgi:hypothetical protein
MKPTNLIVKLFLLLLIIQLTSCEDSENEPVSNLRILKKQVLSANIDGWGNLSFIPQMIMVEGGNPSNFYSWELDTASNLPASVSIGAIDGIIKNSGTSSDGFTAGNINFKVIVTDGENTSSEIVRLQITDYKISPAADVQQLPVGEYQLINGKINQPYCTSLFVMGGTPPYTWAIDSSYTTKLGSYGLSLDPDYGLISGRIPASVSPLILSFKVVVRDSKGKYALFNPIYKITVN